MPAHIRQSIFKSEGKMRPLRSDTLHPTNSLVNRKMRLKPPGFTTLRDDPLSPIFDKLVPKYATQKRTHYFASSYPH